MRDWFDFIYSGWGLIEARFIRDGSVHRTFSSDPETIIKAARERSEAGWDVYVGVLPRRSYGGTEEDVWPVANVLWCDLDAKDFASLERGDFCSQAFTTHDTDACNKQLALDAILKFPVPPSCIVDSGHGFHTYWKLDAPVATSEVVELNKAIAKWVGGDKCFDSPRILRVPGTVNHKDPDQPVPVRLLKLDTLRRYDPADFNEMVENLHSDDRPRYIRSDGDRRQDAPDWLKDLINEEPPKGSRSETEFRAGLWLARYGYQDGEIDTILSNSPVGAKYQERSDRWRQAELQRIRSKA